MVWYYHDSKSFPQFVMIHTVKGFSVVDEQRDVFLKFPCFLYNSLNVGNVISSSSAFSETSLTIWKFTFHVLLKPGLENFEHFCFNLLKITESKQTG